MNEEILLHKIGKLLEPISERLDRLEQGQATVATAVNALAAGFNDLRGQVQAIQKKLPYLATKKDVDETVENSAKEIKAEIFLLDAKISKKIQNHERRIENLERNTNTANPEKH